MTTTAGSDAAVAVHPLLAQVFGALDDAALAWCVVRGEHDLSRPQGDVDLLLAAADLERFGQLAAAAGFAPLPAWGYAPHRFWLTYDEATDAWLKLDVVTELAFGPHFELVTGQAGACLARRRQDTQPPALDDEDAFWALLLHCLLDKRDLPAQEAARLRALAATAGTGSPLARFVAPLLPDGCTTGSLLDRARAGDRDSLLATGADLALRWERARRTGVAAARARNRGWRAAGKVLRPLRRRGASVALLAPDGAGKSTVAASVASSFYFPVRQIYMGLYQGAGGAPQRGLPGAGLAARLLGLWWRWLQAQRHVARGSLVLFDRYPYDAALPARRHHGRLSQARRWLLARACPAPDAVALLDAPGAVLYARKGEQDTAVLERERQAYRALAGRLPGATIIDAAQPADVVRRRVTAVAWNAYRRRWGSR